MSYQLNPKDFNPIFEITGCIIESKRKIVLLKRKNSSIQGNKWGIPSGKVEYGEDLLTAIKREIEEETRIKINKNQIKPLKSYKVRHNPGYDFVYHLFYTEMPKRKEIILNKKEHINATWISPRKALKMSLVEGTNECIKMAYKLGKPKSYFHDSPIRE